MLTNYEWKILLRLCKNMTNREKKAQTKVRIYLPEKHPVGKQIRFAKGTYVKTSSGALVRVDKRNDK